MKMIKNIGTLFFLMSLGGILCGCFPSPLLSHAEADSPQAVQSRGCELNFAKAGLCASVTWQKQPQDGEYGELLVRFWDKATGSENGPYVTPSNTVFVKLWMPAMGHGSSPVKTNPYKDASGSIVPGIFDVTDIYFSMPGAWEIWFQLKQGSQVIDQATYAIQI